MKADKPDFSLLPTAEQSQAHYGFVAVDQSQAHSGTDKELESDGRQISSRRNNFGNRQAERARPVHRRHRLAPNFNRR